MRKNLTRNKRLTKNNMQVVFNKATCIKSSFGLLFYIENNLTNSRFACVLKRKYGNAVKRNYTKRLLKEFFRINQSKIKNGYDIVFLAKMENLSWQKVEQEVQILMDKAMLWVC